MNDVMIDIETLATTPDAVVWQIAVVAFDRNSMVEVGRVERFLDIDDQLQAGRVASGSTLQWMIEVQKKERKELWAFRNPDDALVLLRAFFEECGIGRDSRVWSCGTCFERPVMESLHKTYGRRMPWRYHQGRDLRTAWDLAFPGVKRESGPHDALEDCRLQLDHLRLALESIKGRNGGAVVPRED